MTRDVAVKGAAQVVGLCLIGGGLFVLAGWAALAVVLGLVLLVRGEH